MREPIESENARLGSMSIAGTAYPFPGESHAHAFRLRALVCTAGAGRPENSRLTPTGKPELQLDVASPAWWSQADKGDRIILPVLRLARDRRTGPQIRHGVIPQHDCSVKPGGHPVDPNSTRHRLNLPVPLQ